MTDAVDIDVARAVDMIDAVDIDMTDVTDVIDMTDASGHYRHDMYDRP